MRPDDNCDEKKVPVPTCPYKKKCGGCRTIGENYADTVRSKTSAVKKLLKPYVVSEETEGMEDPYCYRNKVHRVVTYERAGKKEWHSAGIYAEGTHKVIPVRNCLIEDRAAQKITEDILLLAKSFKIKAYNEDTGVGLLRHILIRTAHITGEIMVTMVLTSPVLPGKKNFVRVLREQHPEITTLVININSRPGTLVLGERESVVFGRGYIEDELCGRRFRISSRSFYQVNSVQTEKLYGKAMEYAHLTGKEQVIDAYCGIGTIGIVAAGRAKNVLGIELNRDAVRDAVSNAKLNGLDNCTFLAGDSTDYLMKMAAEGKSCDVLFMDPPRSGSTEDFVAAAAASGVPRIVYISCNPETLSRDLGWFVKKGYRVIKAKPFDMFPWTDETECVALLTRAKQKPGADA